MDMNLTSGFAIELETMTGDLILDDRHFQNEDFSIYFWFKNSIDKDYLYNAGATPTKEHILTFLSKTKYNANQFEDGKCNFYLQMDKGTNY